MQFIILNILDRCVSRAKTWISPYEKQLSIPWLFLGLIISPLNLFAWGATGHQVIAQIAYDYLMTQPDHDLYAADYKRLVAHMANEDFIDDYPPGVTTPIYYESNLTALAHWPDDLKSEGDMTGYGWHFENNLWSFDNTHPTVFDLQTVDPSNVTWAIGKMVSILTESTGDGKNKRLVANINLQARSLAYLIHFVGDAHQPLHCSDLVNHQFPAPEGDQGGNLIPIIPDPNSQNQGNKKLIQKARELHALWDNGLGVLNCQGQNQNQDFNKTVCIEKLAKNLMGNPENYWIKKTALNSEPNSNLNSNLNLSDWAEDWSNTWCGPAYIVTSAGEKKVVTPTPEWVSFVSSEQENLKTNPPVYYGVYVDQGRPLKITSQVVITDQYISDHQPIVTERILEAGYRLGVILKAVFDQQDLIHS